MGESEESPSQSPNATSRSSSLTSLSKSPNLNQMLQLVSKSAENSMTADAKEAAKHALPSLLSLATNKQLQQQLAQQSQMINNNYNKQQQQQQQQQHQTSSASSNSSRDDSISQNKRSRTQLTNGQVNAMQTTFELYRSPSLAECEILGNGIGLARRVVQVCGYSTFRPQLGLCKLENEILKGAKNAEKSL